MIVREYMVLHSAKDGGAPEHLVAVQGARRLRCHCDLGITVFKDRIRRMKSPKVSCKACQEEIDKWESFWRSQDERMGR
jgi:hypothetical protein